jgi:hypothetical protein
MQPELMKKTFLLFALLLSIIASAQKYDTIFYKNKSIQHISFKMGDKDKLVLFNSMEGKSLLYKDSFIYSYFDDFFNKKRIIKIRDKEIYEDYWVSDTDTIYNKIKFDVEMQKQIQQFNKCISRSIAYPKEAANKGVQGKVYIAFIVDKKGIISDAKALTNFGAGLEDESLRLINTYKNWGIVTNNGKTIKVYLCFPLNYVLE